MFPWVLHGVAGGGINYASLVVSVTAVSYTFKISWKESLVLVTMFDNYITFPRPF